LGLTLFISVITEKTMKLTPVMTKFILHWGEMGWRWGINRAVAQVHALLMLSPKPLPADEIAETLEMARSNVSTSIKELQGWGLVRTVHVFGERREHFETLRDIWEMFLIITRERKKRELDPTLAALKSCATEAAGGKADADHTKERIGELVEFLELMGSWADKAQSLSPTSARRLLQLGDKVFRLAG
jgi:DNA-binding transcriptional regulator GbsR (MarR family)